MPGRKLALLCCLFVFTLTACAPSAFAGQLDPTVDLSLTETYVQALTPTSTWTPRPTATATFTPAPTATPTLTPTPTIAPTPTWATYQAGSVKAPILLYHHIAKVDPPNRYFISPDDFRLQMETLLANGYHPVPISQLVDVLINGGQLPAYPVVITFDDGTEDVYQNAFPIMRELGIPGTMFIISNWIGAVHYLTADQILEMISAGWEVGSHSMNHVSLKADHDIVRREVLQSRIDLEDTLGVKVRTFAYPFGLTDEFVSNKVQDYGYQAAVGLGTLNTHTWGTLYYLNRREVQGDYDLAAFLKLLQ
jgi:peptidoglycan/xylan/chitin deacetylase (PgdA/CDA1 family)